MDLLSELNQKRCNECSLFASGVFSSKGETASTIADTHRFIFNRLHTAKAEGGRYGATADANASRYADGSV